MAKSKAYSRRLARKSFSKKVGHLFPGCTVVVLDKSTGHYRITGPAGGVLDYWSGTQRWMNPRPPRQPQGSGLQALLAELQTFGRPARLSRTQARPGSYRKVEPRCIEDGEMAELVTGQRIYPHRPDLFHANFYLCRCGAYVGCHGGTADALGYPANAITRDARQKAHAAIDPLWRGGEMSRAEVYKWLAERLGVPPEDRHLSMFDAAMCQRVVDAVTERRRSKFAARVDGSGELDEVPW